MNVELRYHGETIGPSPLPEGEYRIARGPLSRGHRIVIFGPPFCERGTIFAEPNITISGIRDENSRQRGHLLMQVDKKRLTLTDENSTNGSYLDGAQFRTQDLARPGNYTLGIGLNGELECTLVLTE